MRIERDDQASWRHPRPDAEIDCILPHHPPQVQIEALARAAGRCARKEVTDPWPLGYPTAVCLSKIRFERTARERIQGAAHVGSVRIVTFEEERFDRSR